MNAKKYIEEALMSLLKKKNIDKIKVGEIIREVGTCKGTFYKYYCDKYDLLLSCFKNLIYTQASENATDWRAFMLSCMQAFEKIPTVAVNAFSSQDVNSIRSFHEKMLVAYFENDLKKCVSQPLCPISRMTVHICVAGYTEILMQWLRSGMRETKEELLNYMCAAIPHSIYAQVVATA